VESVRHVQKPVFKPLHPNIISSYTFYKWDKDFQTSFPAKKLGLSEWCEVGHILTGALSDPFE